jgi:hypothetical protein
MWVAVVCQAGSPQQTIGGGAVASIMHTEAGLMLMAEEFDFLRNSGILRIMFALAKYGPLTGNEIRKLGIGKPYRINNLLKYLVEEGKIIKVKRVYREHERMPPNTFYQYFIADEFLAAALTECCDMLERTHQAYADGFSRLSRELKPIV